MNICIVGGGHIGTALTCFIKHEHPEYSVSLLTRRQELFESHIKCNDWERNLSYEVLPDAISTDAAISAKGADVVFVALPHFAVEKAFENIAPYVAEDCFVGVLPGGGGCEFFFNRYFKTSQTLFGFQRVPFTAKLQEYGKEVNLKSWKPFSVVGTLQRSRIEEAMCRVEACGLKTQKATNYLEVALTPTNPILHTSRTYEIFGKNQRDFVFQEKCKFYVGWTDMASSTLFDMDNELHVLLNKLEECGVETSAIRPLSEHYESSTISALTAKINSIPTFQSVYAPMKEVENGFVADTSSRMFTEDFPWGLAVIRSYFKIFNIPAPTIDSILKWYADFMDVEWFVDGEFCGKDLNNTGVLQNYGILNRQQLLSVYCQDK